MEVPPPPISLCTPSSLPSHVDENRLQLWPFPTAVSPSPIHSMCEVAAILRRVTSPFPVSPRPLLTSVPSRMHFGTKPGDHVSCAFFFRSAWCFVSGRERPPPTVRLGLPSPQFCTPPSLCPLILSCLYLIWPDPHFFAPLASKRLRFKSFVMSSVPPTFPFALWIGVSCFTCQSALFFLSSP